MQYLNLKLAYRWNEIKSIREGIFPFPKSLTVFPSEVCNLKCQGCNSQFIHKPKGFMDYDLYREIIDDFQEHGGKAVAFEGGGEPMLHPQINDFCTYTKGVGLKLGIITNGTIFKPEMLLADWIRVSINHDYFPIVRKNIKKLMALRLNTKIGVKLMGSRTGVGKFTYKDEIKADYITAKNWRNDKNSWVKNPEYVEPCGLTPVRAVVDYDGTFYPCPYFWKHQNPISNGVISCWWGGPRHRKAIEKIKNCNWFDCPLAELDEKELSEADLEFI